MLPQRSRREAPNENFGPPGPPYFATSSAKSEHKSERPGKEGEYFASFTTSFPTPVTLVGRKKVNQRNNLRQGNRPMCIQAIRCRDVPTLSDMMCFSHGKWTFGGIPPYLLDFWGYAVNTVSGGINIHPESLRKSVLARLHHARGPYQPSQTASRKIMGVLSNTELRRTRAPQQCPRLSDVPGGTPRNLYCVHLLPPFVHCCTPICPYACVVWSASPGLVGVLLRVNWRSSEC